MCGIFGHYTTAPANEALIYRMAQALAHRGPDGASFYTTDHFSFGAGRLAIIDLAAPPGIVYNEDRMIAVSYNGEIYNYKPLRAELEAHGHVFRTKTDTEVIVHGYEQWGDAVLDRLRGMFALCVWDESNQRALLARDRLGEKPLYYTTLAHDGQITEVLFASEAKALFEHPNVPRAVSLSSLAKFMVLGYVDPSNTMFNNIFKLAPGERMIVMRDDDGCLHVETGMFWQPTLDFKSTPPYEMSVKQVRDAVDQAVEMQMMSDVPIGAFLSGGVDSSAVVGLMRRHTNEKVRTFTVGFDVPAGSKDDTKFNVDVRYANEVAKIFGTQQHVILLKQSEALSDLLPYLIYGIDDLIAMPTIVQTAFVAALARTNNVPVLLNGEASDELFMGYNHYRADQTLGRYLAIPALLRAHVLDPALAALPIEAARTLARKSRAVTVNSGQQGAQIADVRRYLEWGRVISPADFEKLLNSASDYGKRREETQSHTGSYTQFWIENALNAHLQHPAIKQRPYTERMAYTNLKLYVGENSNMRMDKMAMAMSIEARAPLEDYRLAELALSIPQAYKLRSGDFKRVFKDAMRDVIPDLVLKRPKWGFNPPTSEWLRTAFKPLIARFLSREYVESVGIFDADKVQDLIYRHIDKREYFMWELWTLLTFHIWHALYIDQSFALAGKLSASMLVDPAYSTVQVT